MALVLREALTGRLGVPVPLPALHPEDFRLVEASPKRPQDIVRFAEMATYLTQNHTQARIGSPPVRAER